MLENVRVIGFTGKARSGKDTAAEQVVRHYMAYNHSCTEFYETVDPAMESFAGPIKSMVAMLLDFYGIGTVTQHETLYPYIDGDKKEEVIESIGTSPRILMQTLGTDWGRKLIDENIWLNCMRERLVRWEESARHGKNGAVVCITDVRFDNEAEMIKELGGEIVQITRPEAEKLSVGYDDHISEIGIRPDLIDMTIDNSGDLYKLYDRLVFMLDLPDLPPEVIEDEEDEDDAVSV